MGGGEWQQWSLEGYGDGGGMTPIRVVCQNTLNLALNNAKRIWTTKHTENVMSRVHEAEETLGLAE